MSNQRGFTIIELMLVVVVIESCRAIDLDGNIEDC